MAAAWAMWNAMHEQHDCGVIESSAASDGLCIELAGILQSAADWYLSKAEENAWDAPLHQHPPYMGWGSLGHSSRAILPLFAAGAVTGMEHYRKRAADMVHVQMGQNPLGICFITGIGTRSPLRPLSKLSQYDQRFAPLPGIPVNGPHYHLPELWPAMKAANEGWGPNDEMPYPPMPRYVDSDLLPPMSEPTVAELAVTAAGIALISGVADSQ